MAETGEPKHDTRKTNEQKQYRAATSRLRQEFEAGEISGMQAVRVRSAAIDRLLTGLWAAAARDARLTKGVALVATGGYGRGELFPSSDVDMLFVMEADAPEREAKDAIRAVSQQMWDAGNRFSPVTRRMADCERTDPENVAFALALLDQRLVTGSATTGAKLANRVLPRLLGKDRKVLLKGLETLTRERHAKYGDTLFHLEPNVKECPGGLRDAHVCRWLERLGVGRAVENDEFTEAVGFLTDLRCFLHLRHERDDNVLDWQAQDRAAELGIGLGSGAAGSRKTPEGIAEARVDRGGADRQTDAAYWMRVYFRNARAVERAVTLAMNQGTGRSAASRLAAKLGARNKEGAWPEGFMVVDGRVALAPDAAERGVTADPEAVLGLFAGVAQTGTLAEARVETELGNSLPLLASRVEDGAGLWHSLRTILLGRHAGTALRVMHAVGLLDLLVPEFHGIDALVIRDAYHRYTVDEHTFVLIDTLHALDERRTGALEEWRNRFAQVQAELPHPELLYLAALLHDTGKARSTGEHTAESARLTEGVLRRLELEPYEAGMVVRLVRHHLEMSATLRRDIFDAETIRTFAGKVQTQEALRMLVLFTYADLNAVHPDALTPWKAENLWRLYIATANYLDHSVDEERVGPRETELVDRVAATLPGRAEAVAGFLEGFPERYVRTRSVEQIRLQFQMTERFREDPVQIHFRYAPAVSDLVLVTQDRPALFAMLAGALAAWGMNVLTADAFSNREGLVVDSFRFTDSFRTLELNESERDRFVQSIHDVVSGLTPVEKLLRSRRRSRRKGLRAPSSPKFSFHDEISAQSTLLEVVTDDTPGLLRALSLTMTAHGCNIEVALVDTEGETAIDVFYLTREGRKLEPGECAALVKGLRQAVATNEA